LHENVNPWDFLSDNGHPLKITHLEPRFAKVSVHYFKVGARFSAPELLGGVFFDESLFGLSGLSHLFELDGGEEDFFVHVGERVPRASEILIQDLDVLSCTLSVVVSALGIADFFRHSSPP